MSQMGSLSRLVGIVAKIPHKGSFLATTSLRLHEPSQTANSNEASHCSNLSQLQIIQKLDINEAEMCSNFRHLAISPVEAKLSAQALTLSAPLKWSKPIPHEIRLPSLIRPINITVPAMSSGVMEMPAIPNQLEKIEPQIRQDSLEAPSGQVEAEKQAARLIVIRRRKMRKHKLKKLRKKMKFVFLKVRQKREYIKEKNFQAAEMAKVREYEAFNAANYVADILYKVNEKPTPNLWKGKKLPKPIIEELMAKEKEKKEKRKEDRKYREENLRRLEEKGRYYDKEVEHMPLYEFLELNKKSDRS